MLLFGGMVPILGGIVLGETFPDWRWNSIPFHAVVEGIGAFAALIIATLILLMRQNHNLSAPYIWAACGLIGMGILDGFHAVLHAGTVFVWTHSLATFVGGLFFAMVWIPGKYSENKIVERLPFVILSLTTVIGLLSIVFPSLIPAMVEGGRFTVVAKELNIIGGFGFLISALYFAQQKKETDKSNRIVFSTHAFLFGIAGLLFELSELWDSPWWLWHILRLVAYMVAVYYFVSLFIQANKEVHSAQRQLRDAINAISEGFVLYDRHGCLITCNGNFKSFYEYNDDEAAPGVHRMELGALDVSRQRVLLKTNYIRRRETRKPGESSSMSIQLNDGRTLMINDYVMENGEIVSLQTDITSQKRDAEAILKSREEAEKANRAKSEFLANMSHELRTPLNSIIGFSQVLGAETFGSLGSDENKEYVDYILNSGRHLHKIIGDILDLSKIEAGEEDLVEEVLNIDELVYEALEMISGRDPNKKIAFPINIDKELPFLRADRLKILQVLLNLLSNAIKFTPDGGEIGVTAQLDDKGSFMILVKDTGQGIHPDDLKTVLEPFGQAGNTHTRSHEGTGLGLALVMSIMELHGGTARIESEPGRGTIVTILFPSERAVKKNLKRRWDDRKTGN